MIEPGRCHAVNAWEPRILKKIANLIKEKNSDGKIQIIYTISARSGILPQSLFFDRNIVSKEHIEQYTLVEKDDFIYNPRVSSDAPYGPIRRNKNPDQGIVSPLYTVFRTQSMNLSFIEYYFQSDKWYRFMYLNGDTGARSDRFAIKDANFMQMPIVYPKLEEQHCIGESLWVLDSLIAAEKRKLQLIEMKKRLLLQRILSGKMRFVGFCDSWIQLKLDDAICVCSGKDYKHLTKGNIPVYGTGGYMTSVSKALSNRDAIGIGRKGTIDKPYVLHAPFWTVDTLFYALPRNGYDLNFLFAVFQNINWKSKNESTGLPSLSKKNIENTSIITPSIDEQCRIGELFSLFDSILDETNQKIRLLEKKKKALLRDMFV